MRLITNRTAAATVAALVAVIATATPGVAVAAEPTPDVVPLSPQRLLDTRAGGATVDGLFAGVGRAVAGSVTRVDVAGRAGIPADAVASVLNLTIAGPDGPGFATVYPCQAEVPTTSTINYPVGAFVANSVTAKLDADGDVCVFTLASTDIVIDVNGYVPLDSGVGALAPSRLLDTRPGMTTVDGKGAGIGRAPAGSVTKVEVAGRADIPDDATSVIANLTIVAPDAPGFATIYPCTAKPPEASNINYQAGAFVANNVTAKLDLNGDVCIFTLAAADIILDASGYADSGSDVGTFAPRRLLETRPGSPTADGRFSGIGRALAGSVTRVPIAGRTLVPTNATAIIANLTIVSPDGPGFATIYPCDGQPPTASNINYAGGEVVANSVTAKLAANGDVCIFTLAAADILLDVNAYLPGTGAGTRRIEVWVLNEQGRPFPLDHGSVRACQSPPPVVNECTGIIAARADATGLAVLTLSEDVQYEVGGFAIDTGWPDPWVAPDGTEFHFGKSVLSLGRDIDNGTVFTVMPAG